MGWEQSPSLRFEGGWIHREGATLGAGLLRARLAPAAHQDEASVVVLRAMDSCCQRF